MNTELEINQMLGFRALAKVNFWDRKPIGILTGKPLSQVTKLALAFSYRNLNRAVPLTEVAEYANVSSRQLERALHKEIGLGFHAWHTGERVELAKMRMRVYGDTPTGAMIEAGFQDYAEFSHTFKVYSGMCPHVYWEKTQKEQVPLARARLKRRMVKWRELTRLLLLIHEGKASEHRLRKVHDLDREVGPRVYIEPIDKIPQCVEFDSNKLGNK